jgi:kinesin family protein 2/24
MLDPTGTMSSRAPNHDNTTVPFKDRIRPGMVVSWNQPPDNSLALGLPGGVRLAVVLCPIEAGLGSHQDVPGDVVDLTGSDEAGTRDDNSCGPRYLCALVTGGMMSEAYELNMWRQIVVSVSMMEKEVVLEYDVATRYYYISV